MKFCYKEYSLIVAVAISGPIEWNIGNVLDFVLQKI